MLRKPNFLHRKSPETSPRVDLTTLARIYGRQRLRFSQMLKLFFRIRQSPVQLYSVKKQYVGIPSKNANFVLVVVDTENTAGLTLYPTWGFEARSPPEGYECLTE